MDQNRYDDQEELVFPSEDAENASSYSEPDPYDPIENMLLHTPQQPFDLSELDDPELEGTSLPAEEELLPEDYAEETAYPLEESPEEAAGEAAEEDYLPEPVPFRDQEFRDAFGDGAEFDEIMNAPAPEQPIPSHSRPARKGRPKRRKGEFLFGLPQLAAT